MDFAAELDRFDPDPRLREWVLAQIRARDTSQQAALAARDADIQARDLKIQKLILELAHHKRIRFGTKSETLSLDQRHLFEEACDEDGAAIVAELEQQQAAPKTKSRPKPTGRKPLPPELPRIEHRHEPDSCQCGKCGTGLVLIGEDISEQLDVEPARFFVHRHIRPQYACRACETVTAEPVPPAIIDGGLAAPGLHAWVLIQKYLDHQPLYRIERITERHGVPIARSTLAEWVGRLGVALQPLVDRLIILLKQGAVLHADETPVQQLDPGKGKTKRAYLWAYRSNDLDPGPRIVVFDYQTSRAGKHAMAFLDGWSGQLLVDDYGGYKQLFRQGIGELGCFAHARRPFFELYANHQHPVAGEALRRIGELYAVEASVKDATVEARHAYRRQEAVPRLKELHDWLLTQRARTATGSALAKAIDYSLKRWQALIRYADSGNLPIDNNVCENNIRPIALGKKNWLFTGSARAGTRAAAIQSLLATAQLNGIEPYAWLRDALEKLPVWPYSRIDELLPIKLK